MSTRNLPGGEIKDGRRVRLTNLPPSVSRLSTVQISQLYGSSWPVTGIALPLLSVL
jgi:hypothetical protein